MKKTEMVTTYRPTKTQVRYVLRQANLILREIENTVKLSRELDNLTSYQTRIYTELLKIEFILRTWCETEHVRKGVSVGELFVRFQASLWCPGYLHDYACFWRFM